MPDLQEVYETLPDHRGRMGIQIVRQDRANMVADRLLWAAVIVEPDDGSLARCGSGSLATALALVLRMQLAQLAGAIRWRLCAKWWRLCATGNGLQSFGCARA